MEEEVKVNPPQQESDHVLEQYLSKQNRNKKVISACILAFSLVLVGVIMFLSFYQVSTKPKFLLETGARRYQVVAEGKDNYYSAERIEFEKLSDALENSFKMSLLKSIFVGQSSNYDAGIKESITPFEKGNLATYLGQSEYLKVEFEYDQNIKYSDGSDFYSDYAPASSQQKLTYREYYIALPKEDALQDIKIVFPVYGNYKSTSSSTTSSEVATVFTITFKANLYGLRQEIQNLK